MKKNKKLKSKIAMLLCATVLPASVGGMVFSLTETSNAKAATGSASYLKSYVKELNLTNSNFNSSSSSYTLSSSLSGWTGHDKQGETTAGVINTGTSFQSYFDSTYHLSNNPLTKATDKYVMMINSKTKDSGDYTAAKQGYRSSTVSLEANSYYSFQVSFKNDTNYKSRTAYVKKGEVDSDITISKNVFKTGYTSSSSNAATKKFGEYISFSYKSKYYYLLKDLSKTAITLNATATTPDEGDTEVFYLKNADVFYEDEEYVGVLLDTDGSGTKKAYYISIADDIVDPTASDNKVHIKDGAKAYTCNIEYDPTGASGNGNYKVASGTEYFESTTEYDPISASSFGSVYLSGLTDEDGKEIKAEFTEVSSKEWTTIYFFVSTGNKTQEVNLDLWLGAKNRTTTGVVFYDDCHVVQYSENAFWKTYQAYCDKTLDKDFTNEDGTIETRAIKSASLVDLRKDETLDFSSHNFDFEEGIYNDDITSLKNWKKDEQGSGNARVFDVNNAQYFKSVTGYDFVGSTLSCTVTLNGEEVELISENKYVLGLWANDNHVKVSSNDIGINANEIYKIKAYYKVSELSNGNAYLSVTENDKVLSEYSLSKYSIAAETTSSGVSSNSDNNFQNGYGIIEFYVKGGALYNSSVNLSLGLGKNDEKATGCVVFDNVTIEKATSEEFSSASNKLELGTSTLSPSISNGNFDKVTISKNDTRPYSPENWTITKGSGTTFGGVINTDPRQYEEYEKLYRQFRDDGHDFDSNPYYWASWANPKMDEEANNILMLANISKSFQIVKSDSFNLTADSTYKLSFDYKTLNLSENKGFKVVVYGQDGFKLFESDSISSNSWDNYEIYLKSFSGANEIYVQIELDTTDGETNSIAYFDNFKLENGVSIPDLAKVVDMTDFYLNLPTNNIATDPSVSVTPAYTPSSTTGNVGVVKSEKFASEDSKFTIYKDENKTEVDKEQNVFFLQSQGQGTHTLQSKFNLDMTANNYYTLSFKLKTYFDETSLDSKKTYSYGATVGLTGFSYMSNLKSNDEYSTYTLYFHPTEDASANLYFALICDTNETAGAVAIYDLQFSTSTEDDYNAAKATTDDKKFDVNKDKVYVSSANENEDNTPPDNPDTGTNTNSQGFNWLLIPSLIFGLAIVIAVVGFFMRKIKLKKIEIKKRESYDRKTSLNVDVIKLKAKKEQEANIAGVEKTIDKFEKELENLERDHKQKVVALRAQDEGKVSKETDREFKRFAQKRTVISEKIDSLKKQVEEMKSAEYILNLERKIYAQDEMKQRALEKASKKANKAKNESMKTASQTEDLKKPKKK